MNLEHNKIFAALLVAGILAYFAGFISHLAYHQEPLEENAYIIDVAESDTAATPDAVPKGPEPVTDLLAVADIEKGKKLTRACAACHNFEKGGANGVGPNLWNLVGANKASHAGFAYSDAMKSFGGQWNYDTLNEFLYKPKAYVEGTKMNYIGIKKTEDRAAVIAWLRTLSDSPKPLP